MPRSTCTALPRGPAEIKPYLDAGDAEDITRSPNDGEEFVILRGVDYNKLRPGKDPYTVAAYEKRGSRRQALRAPLVDR